MRFRFLSFLVVATFGLHAQNNTVSAGGKAVGSNGSSTYSVGQVVYEAGRNETYSVSQGIQQPFEIVPLATQNVIASGLQPKIYPNPTFSGFYLELPKAESGNPTYRLSDVSGKIIRSGKLNPMQTFVSTDGLTAGIYILKIDNAAADYGSYKIIKK